MSELFAPEHDTALLIAVSAFLVLLTTAAIIEAVQLWRRERQSERDYRRQDAERRKARE